MPNEKPDLRVILCDHDQEWFYDYPVDHVFEMHPKIPTIMLVLNPQGQVRGMFSLSKLLGVVPREMEVDEEAEL